MIEYSLELVNKSITNKIGCGMAITWMVDILVPTEFNMKMLVIVTLRVILSKKFALKTYMLPSFNVFLSFNPKV